MKIIILIIAYLVSILSTEESCMSVLREVKRLNKNVKSNNTIVLNKSINNLKSLIKNIEKETYTIKDSNLRNRLDKISSLAEESLFTLETEYNPAKDTIEFLRNIEGTVNNCIRLQNKMNNMRIVSNKSILEEEITSKVPPIGILSKYSILRNKLMNVFPQIINSVNIVIDQLIGYLEKDTLWEDVKEFKEIQKYINYIIALETNSLFAGEIIYTINTMSHFIKDRLNVIEIPKIIEWIIRSEISPGRISRDILAHSLIFTNRIANNYSRAFYQVLQSDNVNSIIDYLIYDINGEDNLSIGALDDKLEEVLNGIYCCTEKNVSCKSRLDDNCCCDTCILFDCCRTMIAYIKKIQQYYIHYMFNPQTFTRESIVNRINRDIGKEYNKNIIGLINDLYLNGLGSYMMLFSNSIVTWTNVVIEKQYLDSTIPYKNNQKINDTTMLFKVMKVLGEDLEPISSTNIPEGEENYTNCLKHITEFIQQIMAALTIAFSYANDIMIEEENIELDNIAEIDNSLAIRMLLHIRHTLITTIDKYTQNKPNHHTEYGPISKGITRIVIDSLRYYQQTLKRSNHLLQQSMSTDISSQLLTEKSTALEELSNNHIINSNNTKYDKDNTLPIYTEKDIKLKEELNTWIRRKLFKNYNSEKTLYKSKLNSVGIYLANTYLVNLPEDLNTFDNTTFTANALRKNILLLLHFLSKTIESCWTKDILEKKSISEVYFENIRRTDKELPLDYNSLCNRKWIGDVDTLWNMCQKVDIYKSILVPVNYSEESNRQINTSSESLIKSIYSARSLLINGIDTLVTYYNQIALNTPISPAVTIKYLLDNDYLQNILINSSNYVSDNDVSTYNGISEVSNDSSLTKDNNIPDDISILINTLANTLIIHSLMVEAYNDSNTTSLIPFKQELQQKYFDSVEIKKLIGAITTNHSIFNIDNHNINSIQDEIEDVTKALYVYALLWLSKEYILPKDTINNSIMSYIVYIPELYDPTSDKDRLENKRNIEYITKEGYEYLNTLKEDLGIVVQEISGLENSLSKAITNRNTTSKFTIPSPKSITNPISSKPNPNPKQNTNTTKTNSNTNTIQSNSPKSSLSNGILSSFFSAISNPLIILIIVFIISTISILCYILYYNKDKKTIFN
ncbi:hypothetical protein NEOKW01_0911 [Nematocida sp. AWRm80]|nr:hypothetical protein NEOKW01_0911 [Nematocida sp. AWRm80]